MDLKNLGQNRILIIIIAVMAVGGYFLMRFNRDRLNTKIEERRPQFLTMEFALEQRGKAEEADREQAEQLLADARDYYTNRNYREAGSAYHRAIALYPTGEIYYHYARYLIDMRRLTWATETLLLAEELGFTRKLILYQLARLHSELKEPVQAVEYLEQAIEEGFDDYEAIRNDRAFDSARYSITTRKYFLEMVGARE